MKSLAQFEYPFPTIKLEEITHKQLQSFISHWFTTLEKGRKTKKRHGFCYGKITIPLSLFTLVTERCLNFHVLFPNPKA
jgi:hypothetical protein